MESWKKEKACLEEEIQELQKEKKKLRKYERKEFVV